ncbi:MAG: sodium:calcium antiporter [Anaerolineae bacterium]|nr:sodium:calcium antiporter [Anaerolineae bacterium]
MIWLQFTVSTALLVIAANKLAEYADVISIRTRLGGVFIGTLLMAGATSLPEFLTIINSLGHEAPNLAAGNIFGSCMFNMLLLAILDMSHWRVRVLRRVALRHALTAGLAILLIGLATFFILADLELRLAWVGLDSILIMVVYFAGMRLLQKENPPLPEPEEIPQGEEMMSLRSALVGFSGSALALIFITPVLVGSAVEIAEVTGLGTGFVGTTLVGMATSFPELVTMLAAARLGAFDLAVGNLFGSNLFNVFILGATDLFFLEGRFLGAIDPIFAVAGLLGLLLTTLGLINNLARSERRILFVETDALLLIVMYFAGLYFLYVRGIAG